MHDYHNRAVTAPQRQEAEILQHNEKGGRYYTVTGDPRVADMKLPSITACLGSINKGPGLMQWAVNRALDQVRSTFLNIPLSSVAPDKWPDFVDQTIASAKKRPDQVRDQAADIGLRTHRLIESYLEAKKDGLTIAFEFLCKILSASKAIDCTREDSGIPEIIRNWAVNFLDLEKPFQAFVEWERQSRIEITMAEQRVYSPIHFHAGTMDAIGKRPDGKTVVMDWKTSNRLYPESKLQVAAYSHAYAQMYGEKVSEAWIVRLGKTKPEFEAVKLEEAEIDHCYHLFLSAKHLMEGLPKI